MSTAKPKDARLNFRLPQDLKDVIEEAATTLGQSVSDYAIATLVQNSQSVLDSRQSTVVSIRDRKAFVALIDQAGAKPNRALSEAAKRYKKHVS